MHCVTCICAVDLWCCAAVMLSMIKSACLKAAGNLLPSPYSYGFCIPIPLTLKASSAMAQTSHCFHVSALQAWWAHCRQSVSICHNRVLLVLQLPENYRLERGPIHLHGEVTSGFGRGSRQLGFATANLPPKPLAQELEGLPRGVYFGWVSGTARLASCS